GKPFAIGRPRIIRDLAVFGAIHFHRLLVGYIHIPKPKSLVSPGDLLAVVRPHRLEHKALVAAGDLLLFREAILGSDVEFVFARAIRNIGNPLAIWRPRDQLLTNSGRSREIANAAFLRWNREHVAARGKYGSLALRRDVELRDVLAHAGPVLHALVAFTGHRNRQLL